MSLIESGKKEGATLVTGGGRLGDKGYYVQPTVFADVKDDMKIAKEEVQFTMNTVKISVYFFLQQLLSFMATRIKYFSRTLNSLNKFLT